MYAVLRLVDAALLATAGSLGAILLQAQGYADVSYAPLIAGLAGAWLAWITG